MRIPLLRLVLLVTTASLALACGRREESAPPAEQAVAQPTASPALSASPAAAAPSTEPSATAVPAPPPASVAPEPPALASPAAAQAPAKPKAAPAATKAPTAAAPPAPAAATAPPAAASKPAVTAAAPAPASKPAASGSAAKVVDPGGDVAVAATKPGLTRIGAEKCRLCHKVQHASWAASAHAKRTPPLECESCHGPGSEYKVIGVMKDPAKAKAAGLVVPDAAFCGKCHKGTVDAAFLAKAHAHKTPS